MKKIIIILISLITLIGCTKTVNSDEVTYKDGLYYHDQKVLNGEVAFKEKDRIDFKTNFSNGIPSGDWFTYGFANDVVQSGKFENVKIDRLPAKILRIQKYEFNEGAYHEVTYYVIITDSLSNDEKSRLKEGLSKLAQADTLKLRYLSREF